MLINWNGEQVTIMADAEVRLEADALGNWLRVVSNGEALTIKRSGVWSEADELARRILCAVPREAWVSGSFVDTARKINGAILINALEDFDFDATPEVTADIGWDDGLDEWGEFEVSETRNLGARLDDEYADMLF